MDPAQNCFSEIKRKLDAYLKIHQASATDPVAFNHMLDYVIATLHKANLKKDNAIPDREVVNLPTCIPFSL